MTTTRCTMRAGAAAVLAVLAAAAPLFAQAARPAASREARRAALIEKHAADLLARARQLREAGKPLDAYRHAVQALWIEPLDEAARELAVALQPAAVAQWKREFTAARPGAPDRGDAEEPTLSAADRKAQAALQANAPPLAFEKTKFADVLDWLRAKSGLSFHVKWRALEEVGLKPDTAVSTKVKGATFETALRILLDDVSGSVGRDDRLNYELRDGLVHISTNQDLDKDTTVAVYDVRDIIEPPGPGVLPPIPPYDASPLAEAGDALSPREQREKRAVGLCAMIEELVWPCEWLSLDGPEFPCWRYRGLLILRLTAREQRQVRAILRALRTPLPAAGTDRRKESRWEIALRQKLDTNLPELRCVNRSFEYFVQFLRDAMHASVHVKWRTLEEAGVKKDTPINVRLKNVTFRTALEVVLDDLSKAAKPEDRLGYVEKDGVLVLSTRGDLDRETYVVTYDIRDLIAEAVGSKVLASADAHASLLAPPGRKPPPAEDEDAGNMYDDVVRLAADGEGAAVREWVRALQNLVDPKSWAEASATCASARYVNGVLIVNQTQRNHRRIEDLLADLRKPLLAKAAEGKP